MAGDAEKGLLGGLLGELEDIFVVEGGEVRERGILMGLVDEHFLVNIAD